MADDTATITFDNDILSNGQGDTLIVTGNAVVDYTNGSYTITSRFTDPATKGFDTVDYYFGPGSLITDGQGNYTLGQGDTFSFSYNSEEPTATGSMLFTGTTPNYTGGGALSSAPGGTVAVCFVTGTRIRTARGDVPVEDLVVGDRAITATGATRPIVWIGHRGMACGAGAHALRPIRIAAHAFGQDLPSRDLALSPGHPVLVGADDDGQGGHLVPIMCLINGTTVQRMPVEEVTYWHIELDAHDILLAEGLPAESYLDWGDRPWFGADAEAHALANPDFVVPGLGLRCRPVAIDGAIVESERRRLDALFASRLSAQCTWPFATDLSIGV